MTKRERIAKLNDEIRRMTEKCVFEKRSFTSDENNEFLEKSAELRYLKMAVEEEEIATRSDFLKNGTLEIRAIVSGSVAKPTKAAEEVNGLGEVGNSLVDDVHAIPLENGGSWTAAYKVSDSVAAEVTDGEDVEGEEAVFNYVTIEPVEYGTMDQLSKQVKKLSPADYEKAIKDSSLIALRTKLSAKIVDSVLASSLAENLYSVALNEGFIKSLILGYDVIPGKGKLKLYISKADMITLGNIRGSDKKSVYEIVFKDGSSTEGTIKEGGVQVDFSVLKELSAGVQLFGQPGSIDLPMWGNYEVVTDESGEFFKKNVMAVRGLITAGADLVAYHGMQIVRQTAAPTT